MPKLVRYEVCSSFLLKNFTSKAYTATGLALAFNIFFTYLRSSLAAYEKLHFSLYLACMMGLVLPTNLEKKIGEHSLQQSTQLSNSHQRDPISIESTIITYIIILFGRGAWEIRCTPGAQ